MTSRPATVNFHMYQHATFSEEVTLRDSDETPVDLTGYSARLQARYDYGDDVLFTLDSEDGQIVLGGPDGTIKLGLPAEETGEIPVIDPSGDVFIYDLLLTSPDGGRSRVIQGRIFYYPAVTFPE